IPGLEQAFHQCVENLQRAPLLVLEDDNRYLEGKLSEGNPLNLEALQQRSQQEFLSIPSHDEQMAWRGEDPNNPGKPLTSTDASVNRRLHFNQWLLPKAHTGMSVAFRYKGSSKTPKIMDADNYAGIFLFLPGIGSSVSTSD